MIRVFDGLSASHNLGLCDRREMKTAPFGFSKQGRSMGRAFVQILSRLVQYCTESRAEKFRIAYARLNLPRRLNLGGMGGTVLFLAKRKRELPVKLS
jgi:hypothetical protein